MNPKLQTPLDKPAICERPPQKRPFPVDSFPPEILGHIIEWTAQPQHSDTSAGQILWMSQVSAKWRSITLSHSRLFTHADWAHWAPPLLQLWAERAKDRPLSIRLNEAAVNPLYRALRHSSSRDDDSGSDLYASYKRALKTLRQAIPHAESLEVKTYERPHRALLVIRDLLAEARPHMRRLKLTLPVEHRNPEEPPISIITPNLQWLSLSGVHVHSEKPLLELAALEFDDIFSTQRTMVSYAVHGTIFTFCPAVKELSFKFAYNVAITGDKIPLPSVRKLHLAQGQDLTTINPYKSVLDVFQFPGLEELSLDALNLDLDSCADMLAVIPKSTSRLCIGFISPSEAATVPLTVVTELLRRPSGVLPAPKLRQFECSLKSTKMLPRDIKSAKPRQVKLEEVLLQMIKERDLARIRLPLASPACVEMADTHGVELESQHVC
ncbi:hypothetical protein DL93DRAFT_2086597 [Clavulina sp. PMI_390]|nr:hypothetical protein DL93DRAFT_2086597 [Clavulina sp. PMI_390]